jgi:PTS system ascorbate-specific IIA component
MSDVGLVLVTHGNIGHQMLLEARRILGEPLREFHALAYTNADDDSQMKEFISAADGGQGVLILTDLCGASPANQAVRAAAGSACAVVGGVNLPMLMRVWNYRDKSLADLKSAALEGGRRGVTDLA